MSKHHTADEKLISQNLRRAPTKTKQQTPTDYSAPQLPKPGTNGKNQYK
jgi:hypothetical protein